MARSRLHIANCISKLLSIDESNHSEDLSLKIHVQYRVVKSRISVNNSGFLRATQNLQVMITSHERIIS